jgi:miniconductance mechanosensitive channel
MQTIIVRLLQSTPHGLPLELYFYLAHTEWVGYEERAALVQERLLAALPQFGLKVFQHPTGYDFQQLIVDRVKS